MIQLLRDTSSLDIDFNTMILNFGHIFMELVLDVPHLPRNGDHLIATQTILIPGGKSLNQGIGAARAGAKVSMIGTIGEDLFGKDILARLQREGITSTGIAKDSGSTGIMTTIRGKDGEINHISTIGTNEGTSAYQMPNNTFNHKTLVMLQDDMPESENIDVMGRAKAGGAVTFLDSHIKKLGSSVLKYVDYLVLRGAPDSAKTCLSVMRSAKINCIAPPGLNNPATFAGKDGIAWSCPMPNITQDFDEDFAQDIFGGTLASCLQAGIPISKGLKLAVAAAFVSGNTQSRPDRFAYLDDIEKTAKQMPEPQQEKN